MCGISKPWPPRDLYPNGHAQYEDLHYVLDVLAYLWLPAGIAASALIRGMGAPAKLRAPLPLARGRPAVGHGNARLANKPFAKIRIANALLRPGEPGVDNEPREDEIERLEPSGKPNCG